ALLTNDVHHGASAALLRALVLRKQQAATPVLAWPEIAGAIARRTGGGEWAKAAIAFLNRQAWLEYVSLDEALARRAIAIAIAQHLRGADAVYVALASQRDGMLITLDREMLERAPAPVTARTPIDWLNNA
ncbi:MAG: PIN domain-containing protein, partial [Nitrosospira sp.]